MLMHTCSRVMVAADSVDVDVAGAGCSDLLHSAHSKRVRVFLAFAF